MIAADAGSDAGFGFGSCVVVPQPRPVLALAPGHVLELVRVLAPERESGPGRVREPAIEGGHAFAQDERVLVGLGGHGAAPPSVPCSK